MSHYEGVSESEADAKRDALFEAVMAVRSSDDVERNAIPVAAAISYLLVNDDGSDVIGGYYTGGIVQAIGLTDIQHRDLLAVLRDDDE